MSLSKKAYASVLDDLAALLRRRALTAAKISAETGCSKPAAYERIERLRERLVSSGARLVQYPVREGRTGPLADAYFVVDAAKKSRRRA